MAKFLKAVFKRLFQVFIFLLPVQLGYHFWPEWAFVFGIRVDYLSPTLYLTDILFLGIFLLFLLTQKTGKKGLLFGFLAIFLFGFINSIFSVSFQPAIFKWIKIFELFSLGTIVAMSKDLRTGEWVIKPLLLSMVAVSLLAALQVVKGGSLGGLLYFLGERTFNTSTPGVALATIGGREILRAYSLFSHPNSLAGFLGAGIILSSPFLFKRKRRLPLLICLLVIIVAFFLTFSLAPALSLLAVVGIFFFFRKSPTTLSKLGKGILFIVALGSIALPWTASQYSTFIKSFGESYSRRVDLAIAAGKMFSDRPLLGIGLNNFIIRLPEKSVGQPFSWWLQPVHNIFLLSLSEAGLIGFILFVLLLYLATKKAFPERESLVAAVLFVVLTGLFDHYWLTLQQNQLLLAIILGLSFKNG